MYLRNIEAWPCVTHHWVTDIDKGWVHRFQVRDYFTKFSQEALGPNIAIDNVRVMVDVVCIQTVYQLLQLGVVKDLATDSCRIAGVVGELDRVDGINL